MNNQEKPGLYVHIPFCRSKCPYCDFYSVASRRSVPDYLDALQKEIFLYRGRFDSFDSLYLGGGTPSTLGEEELAAIMDELLKNFAFCSNAEITIEANPEDLSRSKIQLLKDLGINRISVGVQSLDEKELEMLGRTHSAKQALSGLHMIRSCGFTNLSVDLIYGFEGQNLKSWKKTLGRVMDFNPQHLSCYQLTMEKDSPSGKKQGTGKLAVLADKMQAAFFVFTSRFLKRHGYHQYEVSNYARGSEWECRHNRKYWRHVPYLGLGPSAHSFENGKRWWNVRSIKKYCQMLGEGKFPIGGFEVLNQEQLDMEAVSLGLRTSEGVDLALLGKSPELSRLLNELQRSGLVRIEGGGIKPTRLGLLVSDGLPLLFFR